MRISFLTATLVAALPVAAMAQEGPVSIDDGFSLGEIVVTARDTTGAPIGGVTLVEADLRRFDKPTLDKALALAPGVNAGPTGGSRNEGLVFIRGFDRFQTTLAIDGVRVFLPADNRIDFSRFLTADLASIQIAKGYVSVIDGPGAIGGAINLVTRRPDRPFEAELRIGATSDGDLDVNGRSASAVVGISGARGYVQGSWAANDRDGFSLSDDFTPTVFEDGGERENSESQDWRINLKAGLTPNATDEYALSYTRQSGEKNAPYHVTDAASRRYWSWPTWDLESLYLITRTRLGEGADLKTRLYFNRFDNDLFAYDDPGQTRQSLPRAFRSFYDDEAYGGNAELGFRIDPATTLKLAAYLRRDRHVETQTTYSPALVEPDQTSEEDTGSVAAEVTRALGPDVDLIVGGAWDWRDLKQAEDFNAGRLVAYPLEDDDAWALQGAVAWRVDEALRLRASASSRARFPTLFERFSSRFGTAVPNPGLQAERALNLEVGADWNPGGAVTLSGAVFHSTLDDALIQIPVALGAPFGTTLQTRNAGEGEIYGVEGEARWRVSEAVTVGGNYTFTERDLTDPTNPAFRPLGVPRHKAFAFVDWRVNDRLTVTPSVEATSDRYTVTSSASITPPRFYETGSAALVGLSVAWAVADDVDLIVGGANLLDEDYTTVDGFPEEGRRFWSSLRIRL